MYGILAEITLVLAAVALLSFIMQWLRQPLVIGYILAGVLVGPYGFDWITSTETLGVFSEIGVSLLLFIIGLELNPGVIQKVGKVSVVAGISQLVITFVLSYLIGAWLGLDATTALVVAIATTFSSTVIVLKLLTDKKETHRLYANIAIGFLLIQDFIAVLALLAVYTLAQGAELGTALTQLSLAGAILAGLLFVFARWILPKLENFVSRSAEFLFIFAVCWGLGVSALINLAGFSIEIGALIAGVTLAASPFAPAFASSLRPLRDFFIIIFFVLLGAGIQLQDVAGNLMPAVVLTLFVLFGNPLIVMLLMKLLGYSSEVGFKSGLTVAQVGEFSLKFIALAFAANLVESPAVALITMVSVLTIAGSTYFIFYSDYLYTRLKRYLKFFENKRNISDEITDNKATILLCGYRGIGREFLHALKKLGQPFVVVDYDPEVLSYLRNEKISTVFGDIADTETLDELNLHNMKMVVSLVPDPGANLVLARYLKEVNPKALFITYAREMQGAQDLYKAGASYVVMPQYLGSMTACSIIEKKGADKPSFQKERKRHLRFLQDALQR